MGNEVVEAKDECLQGDVDSVQKGGNRKGGLVGEDVSS